MANVTPDPIGPAECRSRARQHRLAAGLIDHGAARDAVLQTADEYDRRAAAWAKADAEREQWSAAALDAHAKGDRDAWREAWSKALDAHKVREAARTGAESAWTWRHP